MLKNYIELSVQFSCKKIIHTEQPRDLYRKYYILTPLRSCTGNETRTNTVLCHSIIFLFLWYLKNRKNIEKMIHSVLIISPKQKLTF